MARITIRAKYVKGNGGKQPPALIRAGDAFIIKKGRAVKAKTSAKATLTALSLTALLAGMGLIMSTKRPEAYFLLLPPRYRG